MILSVRLALTPDQQGPPALRRATLRAQEEVDAQPGFWLSHDGGVMILSGAGPAHTLQWKSSAAAMA
jgi:hypothetical protein